MTVEAQANRRVHARTNPIFTPTARIDVLSLMEALPQRLLSDQRKSNLCARTAATHRSVGYRRIVSRKASDT